jgi:hypothetical protein
MIEFLTAAPDPPVLVAIWQETEVPFSPEVSDIELARASRCWIRRTTLAVPDRRRGGLMDMVYPSSIADLRHSRGTGYYLLLPSYESQR